MSIPRQRIGRGKRVPLWGAAALLLFLGACATAPKDAAWLQSTLYFGRAMPDGGVVSPAEWQAFVDAHIIPAFPGGFTILDANGYWANQQGSTIHEPTQVLVLLHPDTPEARQAIQRIRQEYKQQFRQESVLWSVAPTSAQF